MSVYLAPPRFTEKIKNGAVEAGGSYSFKCSIDGFPLPEVRWFKGEEEVHDEGRFLIEASEKEAVLDIAEIEASDCGEYECRITNEVGEETCRATLSILSECCLYCLLPSCLRCHQFLTNISFHACFMKRYHSDHCSYSFLLKFRSCLPYIHFDLVRCLSCHLI